MQVIWVIVTFLAIFSRTLVCLPPDTNLSEGDDSSYDWDYEGKVQENSTHEVIDLETIDTELQNSTNDENLNNGLDEGGILTVPDETVIDEDVKTTTHSTIRHPEGRKKDQLPVNGTCGDPPSIKNAMVVNGKKSSNDLGAVITYSCEFGYVTDGVVRIAQCLISERTGLPQWTQPEILCIPRSCGEPDFVNHANRIGSLFIFPNSVSYECEEGYKLRGNKIRYCQPSGTWSGTVPTCYKLACEPPREIENGHVSYNSLEFGSELRYQCDKGFILRKHHQRVCSGNGTWSGEDPVCQDTQCEPPEPPEHGSVQIIGEKSRAESRAIYTCDGDRVLEGSRVSICMETGEWTFPPPKCSDPCSVIEVPHGRIGRYTGYNRYNKRFNKLSVGSKIENDEELYLRCDSKYIPLGKNISEVKITCNNGRWSEFPKCEPASCKGDPPKTPNARVFRVDKKHGGGVVYLCHTHFKKTKHGNVTCNFGSWEGNTPICSDYRCFLDAIRFPGLVLGSKKMFLSSQSFTPVCENRYKPAIPDGKLTCVEGTWEGHLPPCTAASCRGAPPSIEHGTYKSSSELHGSIVTYECDEGFKLRESGSSKIECLFGKWEGTPPTCRDSYCYEENLKKSRGIVKTGGATASGSYLTVNCADGFTLSGAYPYCNDGIWSQSVEPCEENNCVVSEIPNGYLSERILPSKWSLKRKITYKEVPLHRVLPPSSSLFVTCHSPYRFQGKDEINVEVSCSKGKWVPQPSCLLRGTPFVDESSLTRININSRPTTAIMPIATTSHTLLATETQPVLNGDLENSCTCTYLNHDDKLVAFSGNKILESGMRVNNKDKIKFHCRTMGSYRFVGSRELVCLNCRTWHSSEYPQCNSLRTGDAIIQFDDGLKIQPGGSIEIPEGSNTRFICTSNFVADYPIWKVPTNQNIRSQLATRIDEFSRYWYIAILEIQNANAEHSGIYECAVPRHRTNAIEIQVMSSKRTCPHIQETVDLAVSYDKGQAVNSSALFSCKEKNWKLVGSQVLTCMSNGAWSGNPPYCKLQVKCPEINKTEGMHITYSKELDVGSRAAFHCNVPLVREGVSFSECKTNGQWSHDVPSCVPPTCAVEKLFSSLPENVVSDMENVNGETVPYNFTMPLKCENGHVLLGSQNARCMPDGNWEVSKLECVRGCVSLKSEGSSAIFDPQKSSYRIGEFLTVSCPPGESLSSDVVRLMCLSSGWSESLIPHCQKSEER